MPIRRLDLVDFRNYKSFSVELGERLTILTGPNGAGKTSVIEALQLLTAATSFRTSRWGELVRWGATAGRASFSAEDEGHPLEVAMDVTSSGKRAYCVNGRQKRRVSDAAGTIPSVTFTPEDLELVKGTADRRRAALDDLGGQLSSAYAAVRREYGRVVRHRNVLLRDTALPRSEMAPWDEQLVTLGSKLALHRVRLFHRVSQAAREVYRGLSGTEELDIEFRDRLGVGVDRWSAGITLEEVAELMRVALKERRTEERARQSTLVGPHRDDIGFKLDARDARAFASQGQQRTIALAWKLAEVRVIESVRGRAPILLLDDVMSELDASRRQALMSTANRDVQTLVTSTDPAYFSEEVTGGASVVRLG
jgi:DNA replication and repair protein RecF